jgi:hypothetical protein
MALEEELRNPKKKKKYIEKYVHMLSAVSRNRKERSLKYLEKATESPKMNKREQIKTRKYERRKRVERNVHCVLHRSMKEKFEIHRKGHKE